MVEDPRRRLTQELIADPSIETLFEAAFEVSPFVARADILKRQGEAWHVLEVKSNFSDTSEIKDLIDDLAYTVMVLRRAGLPVARASLVLLSRDYRFGDGTDRLFEVVDKTTEVSDRATEFEAAADSIARVLFDQTQPIPALYLLAVAARSMRMNASGQAWSIQSWNLRGYTTPS